jgi:hypothetical protein
VEPEETSITRQSLGKHVSVTKPNNETIVGKVFSAGSARRIYNEDPRPAELIIERELKIDSRVPKLAVAAND